MSFRMKRRIEAEYARRLASVFKFINANITGLSYTDAAKKILELVDTPQFDKMLNYAVVNMVTMVKSDNEKTWRKAATKGSFGRLMNQSLRSELSNKGKQTAIHQIMMENAKLIKSVPIDVARKLTNQMYEQFVKGNRTSSTPMIVRANAPWLTHKRALLIARTETSKANQAITQVRAQDMGADWYIWRSSGDERVRSSHNFMNGVFVTWTDSPNAESLSGEKNRFGKYHAGCCPNCRCYAEPVIDDSQIAVKIRVYYGGRIRVMGRNQFLEMIGKRKVA